MKYIGLFLLLIYGNTWGQTDECYKPPFPTMCVMADDQNIAEHLRCAIVNEMKLRDNVRGLTLYQECRERVWRGEKRENKKDRQ